MSCGAVVSAPAVVLSLVLGWDLTATSLVITLPAVVYTMFGGVQAVTWTDVKIMVLIVLRALRDDRRGGHGVSRRRRPRRRLRASPPRPAGCGPSTSRST